MRGREKKLTVDCFLRAAFVYYRRNKIHGRKLQRQGRFNRAPPIPSPYPVVVLIKSTSCEPCIAAVLDLHVPIGYAVGLWYHVVAKSMRGVRPKLGRNEFLLDTDRPRIILFGIRPVCAYNRVLRCRLVAADSFSFTNRWPHRFPALCFFSFPFVVPIVFLFLSLSFLRCPFGCLNDIHVGTKYLSGKEEQGIFLFLYYVGMYVFLCTKSV